MTGAYHSIHLADNRYACVSRCKLHPPLYTCKGRKGQILQFQLLKKLQNFLGSSLFLISQFRVLRDILGKSRQSGSLVIDRLPGGLFAGLGFFCTYHFTNTTSQNRRHSIPDIPGRHGRFLPSVLR